MRATLTRNNELTKTGQWRGRDRLRACQKDAVDSRAKGRPERKNRAGLGFVYVIVG